MPFQKSLHPLENVYCIIPLVTVINAQKGLWVGARKRKGGNATVAEIRSANKLTFRNICY